MPFHMGKIRFTTARKAYQLHARLAGVEVLPVREVFSRRTRNGTWELSDGTLGTIALVTTELVVRLIENPNAPR